MIYIFILFPRYRCPDAKSIANENIGIIEILIESLHCRCMYDTKQQYASSWIVIRLSHNYDTVPIPTNFAVISTF